MRAAGGAPIPECTRTGEEGSGEKEAQPFPGRTEQEGLSRKKTSCSTM